MTALMTEAELDHLFAKVEDGLSDAELKRVADFVGESTQSSLQWRGLHILGWARAKKYTSLISTFLDRTDDLSLPAIALRTLIYWFGNAKPYINELKRFLHGIPQDDQRNLQLAALQVSGNAYRQTADVDLLRMIIGFVESNNEILRDAAYDALAVALSPDWDQLSPRQRYDLRRRSSREEHLKQAHNIVMDNAQEVAS